jgi:hypothetical protein
MRSACSSISPSLIQITKYLIMQFSPASRFFLFLYIYIYIQIFFSASYSQISSSYVLSLGRGTTLHIHRKLKFYMF